MDQPWEMGFVKAVFDARALDTRPSPRELLHPVWSVSFLSAVGEQSVAKFVKPELSLLPLEVRVGSAYTRALSAAEGAPWRDQLVEERALALERWWLLLGDGYSGSVVGRQVAEALSLPEGEPAARRLLGDVLEFKATGTLNSRAGSLLAYGRWLHSTVRGESLFPVSEKRAYDYVCELRAACSPPTRATRFVESVAFAGGVLGMFGAEAVTTSGRVKGAALSLLTGARTHPASGAPSQLSKCAPWNGPRLSCRTGRTRCSRASCVHSFTPGPVFRIA